MNRLADFYFCENITEWQDIFCKFLNNEYELLAFEQKIYSSEELENILGNNVYVELISLSFKEDNAYKNVCLFIRKKIISQSIFNKWKICGLIKKAGKFPKLKNLDGINNEINFPEIFLQIYGGLDINNANKVKKDVYFLSKPEKFKEIKPWVNTLGALELIGSSYDDNIFIFMSSVGVFYLYIVITKEMYLGGNFEETMTKLLLDVEFNDLIPPN